METIHWSRQPGKFVNKLTGAEVLFTKSAITPQWQGTVQDWYDTLGTTIYDAILNKDCKIVVGEDVITILQHTIFFKPVQNQEYCGLLFDEQIPVYVNRLQSHNEVHIVADKDVAVIKVLDMIKL